MNDFQLCEDCLDPEPLLASPEWAMEEKLDGHRRMMVKRGEVVKAFTRGGHEVAVPDGDMALAMLFDGGFDIDGEFIGGEFIAFDVPYKSLNEQRRMFLDLFCPFPLVSRAVTEADKRALFNHVKLNGGEGVVFKRISAPYCAARCDDWQRFKFYHTDDFTVEHVDIAKCSFAISDNGEPRGRVATSLKRLPREGDIVRVRYDGISADGKLIRPKLAT